MRILVTGAGGFVGSHLVAALLAAGHEVIAVVRRPVTSPRGVFVELDLSVRGWTRDLPTGVEAVIHLAQSTRYREFPEGAQDMLHINVDATVELVDWAARKRVRRIVFTSTGNVYAASTSPLSEQSPCAPIGFYACSKFAAEQIVKSYAGLLEIATARLFGIYGPQQRQGLVPKLLHRIRDGEAITLAGEVGLRLTPLHVDDCVRFLMKSLIGPVPPALFNLGGNRVVDIVDIAKIMARAMKRDAIFANAPGLPVHLVADSSLAYAHFGIRPTISLEAGLEALASAIGETAS
jgi:UDP-glucose 4-epimerase